MIRCRRCLNYRDEADFRWVPSRGHYHSRCRDCERLVRAERRASRGTTSTRTRRTPSGRAFGVEIELTGPSSHILVEALRPVVGAVRTRGYAATNGSAWELKHDGSVNGHGLELVSPKLYGEEGLETLKNVLAAVNSVGATVDRSCGIHIHFDFRNVDIDSVKRQVLPIIRTQDVLWEFVAPSRRQNGYCPGWRQTQITELENVTSLSSISYLGPRGVVNLTSYPRHGSIEFRSHGGSTNFRKISAWIRLLKAMLDAGEANAAWSATGFGDNAEDVLYNLNIGREDRETLTRFITARANVLDTIEANDYAEAV